MATNFGTADGILQVNYIGPMRTAINNSCKILNHMKKKGVTWNGSEGIIAVHVAHADNIGFSAGGVIPTVTTDETVKQFRLSACKLYGAQDIEGELLVATEGGDAKAFVSAISLKTKGLTAQMGIRLNKYTYSGGRCVGFLNELKTGAGGPGYSDWQFSGDTAKVQEVLTARGTDVTCQFIRLDTYAVLATAAVSAVNQSASTIHVAGALDTSSLPAGTAVGVRVSDADASLVYLDGECVGIYGNAIEPTLFGLDRTDATGYKTLQFINRTATRTGTQARSAFAIPQFQAELDDIMVASGTAPDRVFVHTNFRSTYSTLFEAKMNVYLAQGKEAVGYEGGIPVDSKGEQRYSVCGLDIEQDRHCGRGLAIFMSDDTWVFWQRMPGDLDRTTGSYFKQLYSGANLLDKFGFFWKQYLNVICVEGFKNGLVVGLPIV